MTKHNWPDEGKRSTDREGLVQSYAAMNRATQERLSTPATNQAGEVERAARAFKEAWDADPDSETVCDARNALAAALAVAPHVEREVEAAASMALMYLQTGFVECEQCGHEQPTADLDAAYELASVVKPFTPSAAAGSTGS